MNRQEESRLVDEARRDLLLYRIIDGKLEYNDNYIRDTNYKIKQKGQKIYYNVIKDCKDVMTDHDAYLFLIHTGQWSFQEQKKFDNLPKDIENLKVDYFNNFFNPNIRQSKKIELDYKKKLYSEMYMTRNKYKSYTPEGIATGAMWFEMIQYMYNGSDKLKAVAYYHAHSIAEEDIRNIALSETWLSYFSSAKNIFGKCSVKMTDDQRRLIIWSNIYKNSKVGQDAPDQSVLKDHDAFDGYLINDQRKNKAQKKLEQAKGIKPDAHNVYMFVKNDEQFNEVNSLNTPDALRKIENEFKRQKQIS